MSRITSRKARHAADAPPPYDPVIRRSGPPVQQSGFGPFADAYPLTPNADIRAIRQAERSRDELLGADPEWWAGE